MEFIRKQNLIQIFIIMGNMSSERKRIVAMGVENHMRGCWTRIIANQMDLAD
jgi:hypothetical protein